MRLDRKTTRSTRGEEYKIVERKKNRERRAKYYSENVKKIKEYYGGEIKCERCGYTDICFAPFDFHHREPSQKDFGIHKKIDSSPFEKWKEEIEKCELLCSNCHRKEHSKRCQKQLELGQD